MFAIVHHVMWKTNDWVYGGFVRDVIVGGLIHDAADLDVAVRVCAVSLTLSFSLTHAQSLFLSLSLPLSFPLSLALSLALSSSLSCSLPLSFSLSSLDGY